MKSVFCLGPLHVTLALVYAALSAWQLHCVEIEHANQCGVKNDPEGNTNAIFFLLNFGLHLAGAISFCLCNAKLKRRKLLVHDAKQFQRCKDNSIA